MAYVLHCRALGLDCTYMTSADTREDVLRKLIVHARVAHGLDDLSADVIEHARCAIVHEHSFRYGTHSPT